MTPRTTVSRSAASHRAPRKTRRDAGATRLKTRDIDIVRFGAEQTFVRFDTLGEYLAPNYTPALAAAPPEQLADRTAPTKRAWPADLRHRLMAVSHLMRRLEAQGYVEIIQPWADQPAWFRVTAQGLHLLDLDWQEIPFPAHLQDQEARLRHDRYWTSHHHLINCIRLALARGAADVPAHSWQGERAIEAALPPRESGKHRPHKADGILHLHAAGSWTLKQRNGEIFRVIPMQEGQLIGIEVESTQKSQERLAQILPDALHHHDFVWYFCRTPAIRQALAIARRDALTTDEERQRLRLLLLEDVLPCP